MATEDDHSSDMEPILNTTIHRYLDATFRHSVPSLHDVFTRLFALFRIEFTTTLPYRMTLDA